jgi:iduronate 2-sulfatase
MILFRHARSALLAAAACLPLSAPATGTRPNVLLLCIDDLRPQLGAYGDALTLTPQLDRLAAQSRLFLHHYVQVPTCGASRAALLTGQFPRTVAALSNEAVAVAAADPSVPTLPGWLRQHGYTTIGLGKISHTVDGRLYAYDGSGSGRPEMPGAWDRFSMPLGPWKTAWDAFFAYAEGQTREPGVSPSFRREGAEADEDYPDGLIAAAAVEELEQLSASDRPWFYAVGFLKPHLPFNAPEPYHRLYDTVDFPIPPSATHGDRRGSGEFMGNYGHADPAAPFDPDSPTAQALRRAYAACVTYVDAQVGRVLDALERLDPERRTIVVLWSDHGFHLGHHHHWGKHTLYEEALRSPLMIRVPDLTAPGVATRHLASTVDLFPTLLDLVNLPVPPALSGRSLRAALADPAAASAEPALSWWDDAVSVRTDRHRLTARRSSSGSGWKPLALFDHVTDPHEIRNLVVERPDLIERLLPALDRARAWGAP